MIASARRRTVALCVVATLTYYGLASFVTPALPYVPVPEGWSHAWPSAESALQSWFGLLDAVTALLADPSPKAAPAQAAATELSASVRSS